MKITILGCGRWGTFLAYYLSEIGHEVLLWGRNSSEKMKKLSTDRKNNYLILPANIILSSSLKDALNFSQFIFIAINPHSIRSLIDLILVENYKGKFFISCMKGFDDHGMLISSVLNENFSDTIKTACLIGPGQPQNLIKGVPTCMLVDANDNKTKEAIAKIFESELISVSIGNDLIGNQIGSAAKNIIGIACGILDALGFSALIGSLIVFGLNEIDELVYNAGGKRNTIYGLCCLGDVEATFFSSHSISKKAGIAIVRNTEIERFVPGYYTSDTILKLAKKYDLSLPLCYTINQIIKKQLAPTELIKCIMQSKS